MSWTEYLRKHKHTNKSEDDIYLDYYNKCLCNKNFENEILDEIEYEAKLDNSENNKAREINKYHKQYNKKYYLENEEKIRKKNKEYYLNNKEKLQEKRREYYLKNKKQIKKKYCLKNKKYQKQYYLENKEKIKQRTRERYLKNKEKLKEIRRGLYLKKKLKTASFNLGKKIIG